MERATEEVYWRDRYYATRKVPNLPRDIRFSDDVVLTLDYARQTEVTSSLYDMLLEASRRCDNVGLDEYDRQNMQAVIEFSEIFIVRWPDTSGRKATSSIAAFLVIRPASDFVRTVDPCLADLRIVRSPDVPDSVYYQLVSLAVKLTAQLDCGYTDCIIAVASTCHRLLGELIGRQQFEPVATIPHNVKMADGLGLVDSVLLHKNFDTRFRPPRSADDVLSMLDRHGITDDEEKGIAFSKIPIASIPCLPKCIAVGKKQLPILFRNMLKEDERIAYGLLTAAVARGEGFPVHGFPNFAWFRRVVTRKLYCVTMTHNSHVVGWFGFGSTSASRSRSSGSSAEMIVLDKLYQDQGIGRNVLQVVSAIAATLGFTNSVQQTVGNNNRMLKNASLYYHQLGVLPRAGYMAGTGQWIDRIIFYRTLNELPSIDEISMDSPTMKVRL